MDLESQCWDRRSGCPMSRAAMRTARDGTTLLVAVFGIENQIVTFALDEVENIVLHACVRQLRGVIACLGVGIEAVKRSKCLNLQVTDDGIVLVCVHDSLCGVSVINRNMTEQLCLSPSVETYWIGRAKITFTNRFLVCFGKH